MLLESSSAGPGRLLGRRLYALRLFYGWKYGSKAAGQSLDTHCQEESKWQV